MNAVRSLPLRYRRRATRRPPSWEVAVAILERSKERFEDQFVILNEIGFRRGLCAKVMISRLGSPRTGTMNENLVMLVEAPAAVAVFREKITRGSHDHCSQLEDFLRCIPDYDFPDPGRR